MSVTRAYKEFLKLEQKRNAKYMQKETAKGLLAPRSPRKVARDGGVQKDSDQMDTIMGIVAEIRKFNKEADLDG
jgi:hypothetical protein